MAAAATDIARGLWGSTARDRAATHRRRPRRPPQIDNRHRHRPIAPSYFRLQLTSWCVCLYLIIIIIIITTSSSSDGGSKVVVVVVVTVSSSDAVLHSL